jgi:predicted NUDIX family NTP pyrophosphohydrolase
VKVSAGLLLFRLREDRLEVLLAHPGGPFWAKKDIGAWTIPKGELEDGEDPLQAAAREFVEETGMAVNIEPAHPLGGVQQKGGKTVLAWAVEGELDPDRLRSNTFTIEWPPRSGQQTEFPEIDRVEWFEPDLAIVKLNPAQAPFVDRLIDWATG